MLALVASVGELLSSRDVVVFVVGLAVMWLVSRVFLGRGAAAAGGARGFHRAQRTGKLYSNAFLKQLDDDFKLVLCVRTDLKMQKGKIAAQCGHATLGAYRLIEGDPKLLAAWEDEGQAKVVLKVTSSEEMDAIRKSADQAGLPTYVVRDAGRTQIPSGSKTVLAVGPGPVDVVDGVTGHLKLL